MGTVKSVLYRFRMIKRIVRFVRNRSEIGRFKENYTRRAASIPYVRSFLDYLFCLYRFGASAEDYFVYRFYEKKNCARAEFITTIDSAQWIESFNAGGKAQRSDVEDKARFAKVFRDYLKRESFSSDDLTLEQFRELVARKGKVIVKPFDGFNGNGIFILRASDGNQAICDAYAGFAQTRSVVEDVLEQDGWLRAVNPGTLNTVRVNVMHDGDAYTIVNAIFRCGRGDKVTDNICAGGVVAAVDVETGKIVTPFCDLTDYRDLRHPLTGEVIIGNTIPVWKSVKETVIEAAKMIDKVRYTSWDIAVIRENAVAIVEGNTYGNFNIQQVVDQKGVWQVYAGFLRPDVVRMLNS